jgi:hypothetical protein
MTHSSSIPLMYFIGPRNQEPVCPATATRTDLSNFVAQSRLNWDGANRCSIALFSSPGRVSDVVPSSTAATAEALES